MLTVGGGGYGDCGCDAIFGSGATVNWRWFVTIATRIMASFDAPHGRLSRGQFYLYIEQLIANLPQSKAEEFLELLNASVKVWCQCEGVVPV